MQSAPDDASGHEYRPPVGGGSSPAQTPYPATQHPSFQEYPTAGPPQPWYAADPTAQSGPPDPGRPQQPGYGPAYPSGTGYAPPAPGAPQYGSPYAPYAPDPGVGVAPGRPAAPGRPPGTIALGSALSLVSSSICGLAGATVIAVAAISLRAVSSLFGGSGTSVLSNYSASGLGDDVFEAVVFGVMFLLLSIALAWGAISAITGKSTTTAVVANVIAAIVLFVAVLNIHALLLLLLVVPAIAVIAFLSASSKDYLRREGT